MKTRIKKCLICFKNTPAGLPQCEHCGFKFKNRRKTFGVTIKNLFSRISGVSL